MVQFFSGFLAGASYHFRALILLKGTPQLRGDVLIPILINVILGLSLYLGLLVAGIHGIDTFVVNLTLPNWANAKVGLSPS